MTTQDTELTTSEKALFVVGLERVCNGHDGHKSKDCYGGDPRFPGVRVVCPECNGDGGFPVFANYSTCMNCGGYAEESADGLTTKHYKGRGWMPSEDLEAWFKVALSLKLAIVITPPEYDDFLPESWISIKGDVPMLEGAISAIYEKVTHE